VKSRAIAIAPLTLAALAVVAPLLATSPLVSFGIRRFFSIVCHQDPTRSFWIAGAPVAVCVRCLGIYLGAAMGSTGILGERISRARWVQIFLATAALNAADVAAEFAGLHGNLPAMRFALGLVIGFAAGALVLSSISEPRFSFVDAKDTRAERGASL